MASEKYWEKLNKKLDNMSDEEIEELIDSLRNLNEQLEQER